MVRTLDEADDDAERKVIHDVTSHGWHVVSVLEDEEGPGFAFTIGLFTTFGHPELVMVGLGREVMHACLNELGEEIRAGARLAHGTATQSLLEGYRCVFVEVDRTHYRDYLGFARWWHRGSDFPALQVVWPDKDDRLPWHAYANPALAKQEPLLGAVPVMELGPTTTLWRPVGPEELALIEQSGFRRFPPRLADQPIFYPVCNERYAIEIAERWNVKASGSGFVTRFAVRSDVVAKYPKQVVGAPHHEELWVPAEELEGFNDAVVGTIEVVRTFGSSPAEAT
jgi:hypothetical protein